MGKIKEFWRKGKWQKFVVIMVCGMIISAIGQATGIMYKTINKVKVNDVALTLGESKEVKYTIDPEDYEVKIISTEYKVEDETIAKIDNNKVIGLNEGETKIQIIIKDDHDHIVKSNKAKITVNLNAEQKKEKEEADKIAKRNKISTDEGVRIKDYCKQIIDSILKAPSSAKYPGSFLNPFDDWNMVKKNNLVTVSSFVDAQNSFGANVRSHFVIQIKMNDNGIGKATYVEFDGEVISGEYKK